MARRKMKDITSEVVDATEYIKKTDVAYQIFTGESEDEYYTFEEPKFNQALELVCVNMVKKESFVNVVINRELNVPYSSDIIPELKFSLGKGVIIKSVEVVNLTWLNKTVDQAKEEMKEKELEYYRELIPKLLEQRLGTPIQQQPPQNNKNLLI